MNGSVSVGPLLASLLVRTLSACGGEESDTRAPLGPELIEAT